MKVKDVIMFQVATDRNYKVGDKLEFGKENNFQAKRAFLGAKLEKRRIYDEGLSFAKSKKLFANKELVLKLSKQLQEYDFILRELAFEEVRKNEFKDCPSRLRCMYLTNNKEDCLNGLKIFHQKGHGTFFQAVAVKLNGNIFYSTSRKILCNGGSLEDYKKMAMEYWSQDQNSNQPITEILFEGKAEVVEIFGEYEHKR